MPPSTFSEGTFRITQGRKSVKTQGIGGSWVERFSISQLSCRRIVRTSWKISSPKWNNNRTRPTGCLMSLQLYEILPWMVRRIYLVSCIMKSCWGSCWAARNPECPWMCINIIVLHTSGNHTPGSRSFSDLGRLCLHSPACTQALFKVCQYNGLIQLIYSSSQDKH